MSRAAALLLAAALCSSAAAAPAEAPGPLDAKAAEWAAKGYPLKDRITRQDGPLTLAAAVYAAKDGSGDRLEAYVLLKGKLYTGYVHPADTEWLELDGTPAGRSFGDVLKDGSRVFAYRSTIRAIGSTSLSVVKFKNFRFKRAAEFPDGRFAEEKDEVLVVSRDMPLGRFLAVGCEEFGTTSQSAFRTRIFAPAKGKFDDASAKHPDFYAAEIARKEAAAARLKGDLRKNAGEYLGLTLSLYYDYAARGEARKGWDRQKDFFQIPGYAPASVKSCFDSMRKTLRGRLGVPAAWP